MLLLFSRLSGMWLITSTTRSVRARMWAHPTPPWARRWGRKLEILEKMEFPWPFGPSHLWCQGTCPVGPTAAHTFDLSLWPGLARWGSWSHLEQAVCLASHLNILDLHFFSHGELSASSKFPLVAENQEGVDVCVVRVHG